MAALLAMEEVSVEFERGGRTIRPLSSLSLQIDEGKVVTVWAMRSQGKTTLLRVACGALHPDTGCVYFQGADLSKFSDKKRSWLMREQIGWVDHVSKPLGVKMLHYCTLPLLTSTAPRVKDRAMEAMRRTGVASCASQAWSSLSDQEQILVRIAHAIVRRPSLLLIDDLSANLGIKETDEVLRLITSLAQEDGIGVLMTISDMSAARRSDQTFTLGDGELLGPPTKAGPLRLPNEDLGCSGRGGV
jgi:putative ABC transport system ATP-binding protein